MRGCAGKIFGLQCGAVRWQGCDSVGSVDGTRLRDYLVGPACGGPEGSHGEKDILFLNVVELEQ